MHSETSETQRQVRREDAEMNERAHLMNTPSLGFFLTYSEAITFQDICE